MKEPLLLIEKCNPDVSFLFEWSSTICPMPYKCVERIIKKNVLPLLIPNPGSSLLSWTQLSRLCLGLDSIK